MTSKKNPANITSFLTSNAAPTPKKGKSSTPELTDASELADRAHRAYREMKDAEAAFKAVEADVLTRTNSEYEARAKKGAFTKSFNLTGAETTGVQVTYSDRFSPLAIEQEPGLREQLGSKFDSYFKQSRKLTLKEEATDDKTIKLLREKLGDELFLSIFDIKVTLVATEDMDRKQFEIPEGVRTLCGLTQAKPSLKLIKS